MTRSFGFLAVVLFGLTLTPNAFAVEPVHGLAMHGDLKYSPDFTHFDYINPNAPKGGNVRLSGVGSFDSLNPYILKGRSASSLGLVFDTLTDSSDDATP